MNDAFFDRLRWSARRYGWLLLASVAAFAVLAHFASQRPREQAYDATALVVAGELKVSPDALPQYGETIFSSGAVARTVATKLDLVGDPNTLMPSRIYLQTAKDAIVYTVHGRAEDPESAAELANTAATAFVAELNKPGAGVGSFQVQAEAQPPSRASDPNPWWRGVTGGAVAGLIFGLGVLALFFVLRSPLVDPSRIESVVDVPALGIVTMPRLGRRKFSGPVVVTGLAPLLREVSGPGVDRIELVSPPRADKARSRLALVLALALASSRRVRLHGSDRVLSKVPQGGFSGGGADGDLRSLGGPSPLQTTSPDKELDGVTVLDGVSLDKRLGSPPPPSTVTVLVLPEGYPEPGLRHFKRALTDNDLSGFVLVRRGVRRATELFPLAASPVPAARLRLGSRLRSRPQMDD